MQKNLGPLLSPPGGPFLVFFSPCVHEKPKRIHEHSKIATEWIELENTYLPPPNMCAEKILLVLMGGLAEVQAYADT